MARKNPVPEQDRNICLRLRLIRKKSRYTLVTGAQLLGVDSSLLSSYEHARVPIRFEFGDRFCRAFDVSQKWLAMGVGQERGYILLDHELRSRIPTRMLFSEAYRLFLAPEVEHFMRKLTSLLGHIPNEEEIAAWEEISPLELKALSATDFLLAVLKMVKARLDEIPPHLFRVLYAEIGRVRRQFYNEHLKEISEFMQAVAALEPTQTLPQGKNIPGKLLTTSLKSNTTENVQSEISRLLARLKIATQEKGAKACLARDLRVPQSRVSEWLSGKKEPGGETTLRLLKWVERRRRT